MNRATADIPAIFPQNDRQLDSLNFPSRLNSSSCLSRQMNVRDLERDAALERLRRYRNRRVLVQDIRLGSWEIVVFLAAAAGVVLGKTLGEALNDGFKETRFRQELKEFTRIGGDWLLLNVTDKLRSSKEFFKARIERREDEVVLRLPGPKEDENRLPTWKEFLDDDQRR